MALQVGDEQVGEIVRDAAANDDAERDEILTILRNVYAGTSQPRSRKRPETSNTV